MPSLERVYREHAATVGRWAARLGGPGTDAEDLVQDIFLIVQRKLGGFQADAKITTWLYRITERVVRRRRSRDRTRSWLVNTRRGELGGEISSAPDQLEGLKQRQEIALVYRILDRLRESDRELLVLFEIEDLSGEEIAELKRITLSSVWVRLHRARTRFLDAIGPDERVENGLPARRVDHVPPGRS